MKHWIFLGLAGLVACADSTPPIYEPQDCPDAVESARPVAQAQAVSAPEDETFIVHFRRTVSASAATRAAGDAVVRMGGQVRARWSQLGAVAAHLTPEARQKLAADPEVLAIYPDHPVHAFAVARQPAITTGSTAEYTDGLKLVQANSVWDADNDGVLDANAPIGSNIRVCVIDSGWDDRHPELKAAYVGGKDFVELDDDPRDYDTQSKTWGGGHGTHTAATIVAQLASTGSVNPSEDSAGVVGVAPGVELLVARVLNTQGTGKLSYILSAMEWCQKEGAKLASLSLGSDESNPLERDAFQNALNAGMLAIAAAGNSGTGDPSTEPGVAFPAAYPSVLAVGAVDFDGVHPTFSQVGAALSLVGPGVDVLSAALSGISSYSELDVAGTRVTSSSLEFAPVGTYEGPLVHCGLGGSRTACGEAATCEGFVAYVDRGGTDSQGEGLTFAKKVDAVRRAGARAVIIGNNDPSDGVGRFTLGKAGSWLPTASISYQDGEALKKLSATQARMNLVSVDYQRLTGTSMATPHVTGVAALVWSARPSLTAAQVRDILEKSAEPLPRGSAKGSRNDVYGYGLVQAKAALKLLETYP
ncbi:S8 family serine peptidase [Stigmatella aurantiaca]|uniref:Alkaline protease n=1 Tax=Stigmatella aurantiaca (strain DW4/3-1) TaxID=378806 RepID=Q08UU7_STIAD|nr:S8 family serine peptidase [Stigmatella aurantiaca]ADO68283.1 Peptidase, S8A (Subtilisin) subfamily [Stigmatella aurantiaca DW4/3-1]EAU64253.1 alkaline protease [Stigmatella aurantiaca DW4/3-1]